jgi:hypothetical protein
MPHGQKRVLFDDSLAPRDQVSDADVVCTLRLQAMVKSQAEGAGVGMLRLALQDHLQDGSVSGNVGRTRGGLSVKV